jgi:hypothetical protein
VEERRARPPEINRSRTFHHFPLTAGVRGGAWPGLAVPAPGFFSGSESFFMILSRAVSPLLFSHVSFTGRLNFDLSKDLNFSEAWKSI